MRSTLVAVTILAIGSASPVMAAAASKEENIGVGSGAVIGAIAGGPVGFFIGATVGAKFGDTLHRKNESIERLSGSLQQSRDEARTLYADLDAVAAELQRAQQQVRPDLAGMLSAGIATDLLFRTDEHVLADTIGARLATLAGTLASMPDVQVQLDGFADERGDANYNLRLSEQRVAFVRDQLIAAGVSPARIRESAHGESPAQDASADSYALERRVSLLLFIDDAESVAQLPD